jgi:hypothetical protein
MDRGTLFFTFKLLRIMKADENIRVIRRWLIFVMAALVISGITAVPLEWLTVLLADITRNFGGPLAEWTAHSAAGVAHVAETYPFLFYGTDWLAFAHIVIALAFIGPYRDPVRNRWVMEWGLWCCALVVLVSFAWAPVRGIPFFWRCVDASFGVFGAIPLWIVLRRIDRIEQMPRSHR